MRIIPGIANIKITTSFFIVTVNPEPINSSKQVIPTIAVHPPKMIPAEINPETNVFQNTLPFETFLKASIISKSLTLSIIIKVSSLRIVSPEIVDNFNII